MSANDFDIFQHDGHKLQACGGSTGHFIKTVAMCDSAAIANFLLTAVNAYDKQRALIENMVAAFRDLSELTESGDDPISYVREIANEALAAAKSEGFDQ